MGSLRTEKICILGAGPGGASAALFLASKNIPCILIDKAVFPRDKICGDAISGKSVEVLNKLNPDWVPKLANDANWLGSWGVTFVAPNSKELRVPFKREFDKNKVAPGFVVRRTVFDNFLVEECKKNSLIEVHENCTVSSFEKSETGWKLRGKNGEELFHCQLLIVADGAQSKFAREIAGHSLEPKNHCAGLRSYYKGIEGLDPDNFIELHFVKKFLPGYFWIFPLPNGMANVGVGMRTDKVSKHKINLKNAMLDLIASDERFKKRFKNAELIGDVKGFGLPLGSRKRKISGDHFLLLGDAASLIDPFTGEGIGNAMYCGMFAAEQAAACIQANDFSAQFLSAYDKAVYNRLWSELKLSRRMQQMVNFPWLFNLVVNKAKKNKMLSETISCMFDDLDMRKRLRSPKFYFQLLFANGNR